MSEQQPERRGCRSCSQIEFHDDTTCDFVPFSIGDVPPQPVLDSERSPARHESNFVLVPIGGQMRQVSQRGGYAGLTCLHGQTLDISCDECSTPQPPPEAARCSVVKGDTRCRREPHTSGPHEFDHTRTFPAPEVETKRYTVAVDFDGVIHSYSSGWQGASVCPDPPVDGAIEWLNTTVRKLNVVILTTRGDQEGGNDAVMAYLRQHGYVGPDLLVTSKKIAALVYIDDRGWRFEGTFPTVQEIHQARPWNKKTAVEAPAVAETPLTVEAETCKWTYIQERTSGHFNTSCNKVMTTNRSFGVLYEFCSFCGKEISHE